ncbi:uncharacterized protein G2W53_018089 [Senna tora]|uniref:Uncharacterized protein n=1 Tax=Senna tora TaxID=362788 RepID=A0A834WKR6_9FABA|nr:uncharacterized protein G2W53_018089 [Senna tora]
MANPLDMMIPTKQPPSCSNLKQLLIKEFANISVKFEETDYYLDAVMGACYSHLASSHTRCKQLKEEQERLHLKLVDPTGCNDRLS